VGRINTWQVATLTRHAVPNPSQCAIFRSLSGPEPLSRCCWTRHRGHGSQALSHLLLRLRMNSVGADVHSGPRGSQLGSVHDLTNQTARPQVTEQRSPRRGAWLYGGRYGGTKVPLLRSACLPAFSSLREFSSLSDILVELDDMPNLRQACTLMPRSRAC
jgi:hypothetical protein